MIISIGTRFGRLTVQGRGEKRWKNSDNWWLCKCDCGKEKSFAGYALSRGDTNSCGCLRAESNRKKAEANVRHGYARHRKESLYMYRTWSNLKQRCLNPKNPLYCNYGGRGIKVCGRWVNSFENFLADVGERPPGMSINRINNDGDYEPANCCWSTRKEQQNNTRFNTILEFQGTRLTLSQWVDRLGIKMSTLCGRLDRGWSVERALTEAIIPRGQGFARKREWLEAASCQQPTA
jgi:hypothetical protein